MTKIREVQVCKLFGYMDKEVLLRVDEPTILTGSNGSGKTQLLRALHSLIQLDVSSLARLPLESVCVTFSNGTKLKAELNRQGAALELLVISAERAFDTEPVRLEIRAPELRALERKQIEASRQLDPIGMGSSYIDRRSGRRISFEDAQERYGFAVSLRQEERRPDSEILATRPEARALMALIPSKGAIAIDTKRLDSSLTRFDHQGIPSIRDAERNAASRIEGYLDRVTEQIDLARRRSIRANQSADSSFASRALDKAHATVGEADLRRRYRALVEQSAALAENGLHFGDAPPALPENRMNPTEKRILAVFLEDWQRRLRPLLPVNRKIELFRHILDEKLAQSFKGTMPTPEGIGISDSYGRSLRVSQLSSGEQHLLALFTRLLFDTSPGTLVLVDEPEISLHAAWQQQFIDDLERISKLVDIQVVIATHSPSIVNNRWDLEVALQPERPPRVVEGAEEINDLEEVGEADA